MLVDDELVSQVLRLRLTKNGYHVITASDGASGLAMAVKHKPDVIIMDISMPAGDGITVADRLKDLSETANIPVIFLTATHDLQMWKSAQDMCAFAFWQKPYEPQELLDTIKAALRETAQVVH